MPPTKTAASSHARRGDEAIKPRPEAALTKWLVEHAGLELPNSPLRRYGIATAAIVVALLLRLWLDPLLLDRVAYGFFLIATAFVAWRCGTGPAIYTALTGVLLGNIFFEEPRSFFTLESTSGLASLISSVCLGLLTALFCGSLRHTAAEYAQMYQQSRESERRKDEFLAMLAHELRNPLTPMRNALYLLEAVGPHEPKTEEMHRMIGAQVEHLMRLVDDLLDVARITQGKISLKSELVEAATIAEAALAATRPVIDEKNHEILVRLPTTKVYLSADRIRLVQSLINLLNNATKYTDPSGRIWLVVEATADEIMFRVRDTGTGLTADECKRVFNLFEQGSQTIEKSKGGLGIGLTLVRKLVELHGGSVEAQSPGLGLGSEFIVRLPRVDAPRDARAGAAHPNVPLPRKSKLRVVVIDDVPAASRSLGDILKLWNYDVRVCNDAFAALDVVRTFKPDLILADIGMPQMNGYQLAEQVRRMPEGENVVLIAITGFGQPADIERSQTAGFDRHLVKPVDPIALERMLADYNESVPVGVPSA